MKKEREYINQEIREMLLTNSVEESREFFNDIVTRYMYKYRITDVEVSDRIKDMAIENIMLNRKSYKDYNCIGNPFLFTTNLIKCVITRETEVLV